MNADVGLAWWLLTAPARFAYGVAVGWSRIWFGDPDRQPGTPAPRPDGPFGPAVVQPEATNSSPTCSATSTPPDPATSRRRP